MTSIRTRILTGWTLMRAIYLIIGILVMTQSFLQHEWFGFFFGGYFASMGLFAFGCAAGNCYGGNCSVTPKPKASIQIEDDNRN